MFDSARCPPNSSHHIVLVECILRRAERHSARRPSTCPLARHQQRRGALLDSLNLLVDRLARPVRSELLVLAQPCNLDLFEVLCKAGVATQCVYFPTSSYVSLVSASAGSRGVELDMVGREGMLGAHVALGVLKQPLHAVVQGRGEALRIPVPAFSAFAAAAAKGPADAAEVSLYPDGAVGHIRRLQAI